MTSKWKAGVLTYALLLSSVSGLYAGPNDKQHTHVSCRPLL
jgi:hypothetical protein